MRIRKATPDDAPRIAEIHVRSWQAAYEALLPPEFLRSLDLQRRETMWRLFLEKGETLFVTEDDDSQIVGFLHLGAPRDEDLEDAIELFAIYLQPEHYGTGLGSVFWKTVESQLPGKQVYLWVLAQNRLGIAFYEKNGFLPDGRKKTFKVEGQEFEELRYCKQLNA